MSARKGPYKATLEDAREMVKMLDAGMFQSEVAKHFGCSKSCVQRVRDRMALGTFAGQGEPHAPLPDSHHRHLKAIQKAHGCGFPVWKDHVLEAVFYPREVAPPKRVPMGYAA